MRDVPVNIVESIGGIGIEAWRLFSRKWHPMTHAGCSQLVADIISFRTTKSDEVLSAQAKWEAEIAILQRDHK